MILATIVIFWLAIGSLCAYVASQKGRSALNWFLLGILFDILALVALAALPSNKGTTAAVPEESEYTAMREASRWIRTIESQLTDKDAHIVELQNEIEALQDQIAMMGDDLVRRRGVSGPQEHIHGG